MHGIYIDPENDVVNFAKNLCKFVLSVDFSQFKSKPYSKYVKLGYDKSIYYMFTIKDIQSVLNNNFKKLDFLRDDPEFKFRIVLTDKTNTSNATHCYDKNRITIIINTDFKDIQSDIEKKIKNNSKIIGTLTHELTHAFDYSKTSKTILDKNKHHLYTEAKKELKLTKQNSNFKIDVTDVIKDASEIYKFYHTILYYTQQTEMNAYLRTFQYEVLNNKDEDIKNIETYRRYKWMKTFLSKYDEYDNKDSIVEKLKNSSYPTCFGKVNKVLNNTSLDNTEKLRKINFIISHNYIEYELKRLIKIYGDIKTNHINEQSSIHRFDYFKYLISDEAES